MEGPEWTEKGFIQSSVLNPCLKFWVVPFDVVQYSTFVAVLAFAFYVGVFQGKPEAFRYFHHMRKNIESLADLGVSKDGIQKKSEVQSFIVLSL